METNNNKNNRSCEASQHPPQPPSLTAAGIATTPTDPPRRRGGGGKRKAGATGATTSSAQKRLAKERNPSAQQTPPNVFLSHNGPVTRARQIPKVHTAAPEPLPDPEKNSTVPTLAGGAVGTITGGEIAEPEKEVETVDEATAMEAEFEAARNRGAMVHVVPTHAGWFSWDKIHPIEKHTLTSFFNGKSASRTPDVYRNIRDSIMKKFHFNPQVQLELKNLADLAAGDINARQEVMEFLDNWGLINFHPFAPSTTEHSPLETNTTYSDEGAKASSLVDKLYQFETDQSSTSLFTTKPNLQTPAAILKFLPESVIADELIKAEGPSVEYHCNSCSADCSRKRYHCQKQADFDLCTECYNNDRFGSGMAPTDFILMESAEAPGMSGGNWTDQETLLLLEALELFGENWSEIAEHVATKTKTQCILHFLQMPIEDPFLEDTDAGHGRTSENTVSATTNQKSSPLQVRESEDTDIGDVGSSGDDENATDKENGGKNDHAENKEKAEDNHQSVSSSVDFSKKTNTEESVSCETDDGMAINILKSAFQAVGCFPEPGELLSFAEAGNPVMALAAFLARLAGPDKALASTHSSLRAISENSPSIQLATRHCFILEDPPSYNSDLPPSESAPSNIANSEYLKGDIQTGASSCENEERKSKVERDGNTSSVLEEDSSQGEKKSLEHAVTNSSERADANTEVTENTGAVSKQRRACKETDVCDPAAVVSKMDIEQQDKGEEVIDEKSSKQEQTDATEGAPKEIPVTQTSDTPNTKDSIVASAPPEERESQQIADSISPIVCKKNADEDEQKTSAKLQTNNDKRTYNRRGGISTVRRAAVTALSAAAVKAKLLAKEEEEQILQLVSLTIEKQLYKLETKLSFLADIESVLMRVREQTDRARQKLFQERAHIIAARLGLPAYSARGNLPLVPPNKLPMGYIGARPPYPALQRLPGPSTFRKP